MANYSSQEAIEESKGGTGKNEGVENQIIRESGFYLSDREEQSAYNFDQALQEHKAGKEATTPGETENSATARSMAKVDRIRDTIELDYEYIPDESKLPVDTALPSEKKCALCRK